MCLVVNLVWPRATLAELGNGALFDAAVADVRENAHTNFSSFSNIRAVRCFCFFFFSGCHSSRPLPHQIIIFCCWNRVFFSLKKKLQADPILPFWYSVESSRRQEASNQSITGFLPSFAVRRSIDQVIGVSFCWSKPISAAHLWTLRRVTRSTSRWLFD